MKELTIAEELQQTDYLLTTVIREFGGMNPVVQLLLSDDETFDAANDLTADLENVLRNASVPKNIAAGASMQLLLQILMDNPEVLKYVLLFLADIERELDEPRQ